MLLLYFSFSVWLTSLSMTLSITCLYFKCSFSFCIVFNLFLIILFIYLCLCSVSIAVRLFSSCGERGLLFSWQWAGFSLRWLLLLLSTGSREQMGFSSCGSQAREHRLNSCGNGLSCSAACGIFSDQGVNLCLLHWQADSLLLSHQGSLCSVLIFKSIHTIISQILMKHKLESRLQGEVSITSDMQMTLLLWQKAMRN